MSTAEVVRLGPDDGAEWDAFVEAAPQGTVFSTWAFVQSLRTPHSVWAVRDRGVIQAGVVCLEDPREPGAMYPGLFEFTPYQGILLREAASPRRSRRIDHAFRHTDALARHLAERYTRIFLPNSWLLRDVRPFTWLTHDEPDPGRRFRVEVRYTALSELTDRAAIVREMRDGHREGLRAAERAGMETRPGGDFETFRALYLRTFEKQGITVGAGTLELAERIHGAMERAGRGACWTTYLEGRPVSLGYFLLDAKRAYYLWGCSEPEALRLGCSVRNLHDSQAGLLDMGIRELDWVGVNSPQRGFFKQGFGGGIEPYFLLARDAGPVPSP